MPHCLLSAFDPILQSNIFQPRFDFLRESIRNLRSTGSVAPSSRFLCRAIASKIDPEKARIVVELGPGDGVVTRFILDRLGPEAKLLIFEINEVFVEKIKSNFDDPRLAVDQCGDDAIADGGKVEVTRHAREQAASMRRQCGFSSAESVTSWA